MDLYARLKHHTPVAPHRASWNAVAIGSHLAAALIARVEEQERMLGAAAWMRSGPHARSGGDHDPACGDALAQSAMRVSVQVAAALAAAWRLIQPRGQSVDIARLVDPAIARMWR